MTKPTKERTRQREAEERDRHHAQIATCPSCGAKMRRRLDGTWWHGKGACVEPPDPQRDLQRWDAEKGEFYSEHELSPPGA